MIGKLWRWCTATNPLARRLSDHASQERNNSLFNMWLRISSYARPSLESPSRRSNLDQGFWFDAAPSTSRKAPMTSTDHHIDFNAPAVLRKWPSLKNERRTEGPGPYLVVDGTLNECIRSFMAKPVSMRHLYEIHTFAAASSSGGRLILERSLLNLPGCRIFSDCSERRRPPH